MLCSRVLCVTCEFSTSAKILYFFSAGIYPPNIGKLPTPLALLHSITAATDIVIFISAKKSHDTNYPACLCFDPLHRMGSINSSESASSVTKILPQTDHCIKKCQSLFWKLSLFAKFWNMRPTENLLICFFLNSLFLWKRIWTPKLKKCLIQVIYVDGVFYLWQTGK